MRKNKVEVIVPEENMLYAAHVHSPFSDGLRTYSSMFGDIKRSTFYEGLLGAEHDSEKGLLTFLLEARRRGIVGIPGIEFGCLANVQNQQILIEIIGYFPDVEPVFKSEIPDICAHNQLGRIERTRQVIHSINQTPHPAISELGPIDCDEFLESVPSGIPVGRPHIAKFLLRKNYVEKYQQAFDLFLDPFSSYQCFYERDAASIDDVITAIHKANGIVVVPHPGNIELHHRNEGITYRDFYKLLQKYAKRKRYGIHGVETCYPYDSREKLGIKAEGSPFNERILVDRWIKLVEELSRASRGRIIGLPAKDYHGDNKDAALTSPDYGTPLRVVEKLFFAAYQEDDVLKEIRKHKEKYMK